MSADLGCQRPTHTQLLAAARVVPATPKVRASGFACNSFHLHATTRAGGRREVAGRREGQQAFTLLGRQALDHHHQHGAVDQSDSVGLGYRLGLFGVGTAGHKEGFTNLLVSHYPKQFPDRLDPYEALPPCLALNDGSRAASVVLVQADVDATIGAERCCFAADALLLVELLTDILKALPFQITDQVDTPLGRLTWLRCLFYRLTERTARNAGVGRSATGILCPGGFL